MTINKYRNLLAFTFSSLSKRRSKNLGIILIFSLVVFMIGSILFLSDSIKWESKIVFKNSPEIIVQKIKGGRHELIPILFSQEISKIHGVSNVKPRFWGYYYDSGVKANYTIIGVTDTKIEDISLLQGRLPEPEDKNVVAIGSGIANVRITRKGIGDLIYLFGADGRWKEFTIIGIFDSDSSLLTHDLIVLSMFDFKRLFDIPDSMATDLIVSVPNEKESATVARKIRELIPDSRPILKDEILRTYDAVFGWRSGITIALMFSILSSFVILAWDKATGLSDEEKREIGILKALGWDTADVISMKFLEGMIISLTSVLTGLILAYFHVFFFKASLFSPILKGWSVIYPDFDLTPFINIHQIVIISLITIATYISATIIPSWRAATTEPDIVMKR